MYIVIYIYIYSLWNMIQTGETLLDLLSKNRIKVIKLQLMCFQVACRMKIYLEVVEVNENAKN